MRKLAAILLSAALLGALSAPAYAAQEADWTCPVADCAQGEDCHWRYHASDCAQTQDGACPVEGCAQGDDCHWSYHAPGCAPAQTQAPSRSYGGRWSGHHRGGHGHSRHGCQ